MPTYTHYHYLQINAMTLLLYIEVASLYSVVYT